MEKGTNGTPVLWAGSSLKRRARELLSRTYGKLFLLGVVSVLLGDWMGGWLRVQIQLGPLHEPFQTIVHISDKPCDACSPKLKSGIPVGLIDSPEWADIRDRFGLSDVGFSAPNSTNDVVRMEYDSDSWRVSRTERDADGNIVSADSYEYQFPRVWHADLFGRPILVFSSPWVIVEFLLVALLLTFLVCNPLTVAIRGALLDAHRRGTAVAPRPPLRWGNAARVLFLKDISVFLWGLLLIVPGIVKSYEWRLVPFLLADHPSLSWRDAARISCTRMNGHKRNAFLLDLSFLGWWILGSLSFGILHILFTVPYYGLTLAGLYETLAHAESAKPISHAENLTL